MTRTSERGSVVPSCAENQSDRVLVALTAAGDREAFDQLYRRHRTRVYAYVRGIVRDPALAEDLLTETMLLVWQRAGQFAGRSQVSTWILGIARHKALDAVRAHARTALGLAREAHSPSETVPSPADCAHEQQVVQLARQALQRLSRRHSETLRLAFFDQLPYRDIARILCIPPNTVKSRVYYAKEELGRQMCASVGADSRGTMRSIV